MIYKFVIGIAIAALSSKSSEFALLEPVLSLLSKLYISFPAGIQGAVLLLLRASVGLLFLQHGFPKITHLKQWAASVKMPIFLCFLSALSMLLGGVFLIVGLLTPIASFAIFGSIGVAMIQEIFQGLPFVALDPYLIPAGQYEGKNGKKGEPPSWEKAFIYCLLLITITVLGPGAFSWDAAIFAR
jgi:putative oxidoreductase